ncbi:hypothetical protein LIT25_25275 [Bacillus sp. F19]|nr:hypothetical protein LIT25_25275 [Bacillus sp. F19]
MGDFVLAEELGAAAGQSKSGTALGRLGQADKDPAEKALYAFTAGAVLTEGLERCLQTFPF